MVLGSLCLQNMLGTQLGDGETSFPILSLIGTIAFYGLAFIFLTSCLLSSINFAVYQRKLNKMKIGDAIDSKFSPFGSVYHCINSNHRCYDLSVATKMI